MVRFEAYLQILPAFLSIKPELATTSNLQKIIDKVLLVPYLIILNEMSKTNSMTLGQRMP